MINMFGNFYYLDIPDDGDPKVKSFCNVSSNAVVDAMSNKGFIWVTLSHICDGEKVTRGEGIFGVAIFDNAAEAEFALKEHIEATNEIFDYC